MLLHTMRGAGSSFIGKLLLTGLALAFIGWGIAGYLAHQTGAAALTVNGQAISVADLKRAYDTQVKGLTQLLGSQPTPQQLQQFGVTQSVLTEAINRVVLRQTAQQLGLRTSVTALRDEISAMPVFASNGKFDPARYGQLVAQAGLSVPDFEADLAKDLAVRSLAALVQLPTPSAEAMKPLTRLEDASTALQVLTLAPTAVPAVTPTPQQVKDFYTQNPTLFQTAEKRSFSILRIYPADLAGSLTISPQAIQKKYDEAKASFQIPEQRTVLHILFDNEEAAREVAKTIHTQAEFEAAAQAHSLDTGSKDKGGSLGTIAKQDVVPAFADLAFTLPEAKVGGPVKSPFGYHLVWVAKILPAHQATLAEVEEDIKRDLLTTETESTLQDLSNQIADGIAGGQSLQKIGEKLGLKVTHQTLLEATSTVAKADELQAAFAGEQGSPNTDPIAEPNGALLWVETTDIAPAKVPPLETIKADVTAKAAEALRQQALQRLAQTILQQATLQANGQKGSLQAAAQAQHLEANLSTLQLSDVTKTPGWLQPALLDVNALPTGSLLSKPLADDTNTLHLVQVTGRTLPNLDPQQLQTAAGAYAKRAQADLEALLIGHLRQGSKIESNLPLLHQIFPDYIAQEDTE